MQAGLGLFVGLRYGLLAMVVGMFVGYLLQRAPITLDWSTWYVWHTAIPMVCLVSLGLYGFWISLGDRPFLMALGHKERIGLAAR
jgi:predicted lysophospholipase L1 biosynthesis ABC-type transport system permease subunit